MYQGCIKCGFVADRVGGGTGFGGNFCPDCGDPMIMSIVKSQLGAEGDLEMQKEYCEEHGIERDWSDR